MMITPLLSGQTLISLVHATTLLSQPMSDSPSHVQMEAQIRAQLCDPWLFWANHKPCASTKVGSVFILTPLHPSAKRCNPNEFKVIQT